jgi:nanoRNase/pAp phosphatase (c-di-AMP/oligoRNAs hydrolase)
MEVITTHMNADFDGLASMVAAKKFYPDAVLAFAGSQEKNIREFFIQSNHFFLDFKRQREISMDKVTRLILVDTQGFSNHLLIHEKHRDLCKVKEHASYESDNQNPRTQNDM